MPKARRVSRASDKRVSFQLQENIKSSESPEPHSGTHAQSGADTVSPSSIGAETPPAAQVKADTAESNANGYTDTAETSANGYTDTHEAKANPHSGSQPINSFTTANRPAGATTGYMGFDTDLGQPIWYSGTDWVDATGTIV